VIVHIAGLCEGESDQNRSLPIKQAGQHRGGLYENKKPRPMSWGRLRDRPELLVGGGISNPDTLMATARTSRCAMEPLPYRPVYNSRTQSYEVQYRIGFDAALQ
jgi:hypothetical protein